METQVLVLHRDREPKGERVRLIKEWAKPTGEILAVQDAVGGGVDVIALFSVEDLEKGIKRMDREAPELGRMLRENVGLGVKDEH